MACRTLSATRTERSPAAGDRDLDLVAAFVDLLHPGAGVHPDAEAPVLPVQLGGDLLVLQRQNPVQELHDGDLDAVVTQDVRELDTDGPGTDDDDAVRQRVAEDLFLVADHALRVGCQRDYCGLGSSPHQRGELRWLLSRSNRTTGKLAFYLCWSPPVKPWHHGRGLPNKGRCNWSGLVGEWGGQLSILIGAPAVTFYNWPSFSPAFTADIRGALGGRTGVVASHW
ncbi:hypothetical protein [Micromonospora sp. WMMD1155]|uniref:hypothetical protein n=1 Tax=Micromonospora sp. WMMD1155 TaxID=3016094 RepID=UPI00249BBA11|nr:hypothetical protein [Micromonospora sp. WMMD1155]WFE55328.1 hypothetical protein O7617_03610 [Micromonospora sp. WMMD1155]